VGTPAFAIVQGNPLKFKGEVPERYANVVRIGDTVTAITASTSVPLSGEITRVGPAVDTDTRAFPILARINNDQGLAKAGAFARLTIVTQTHREAIVVPEQAVSTFAGNPRVFVVLDGRVKETPIRVAGKNTGRVLVSDGLTAGQKVAATAVDLLTDGRAVSVR